VASQGLPTKAEGWLELPGVGPYTSASIASIAFGEPVACVDGNVVRILARLTRDGESHGGGAAAAKAFTGLAQELLNPAAPGDHNQAMMELGATVCVKHAPRCPACPVRAYCAGAKAGDAALYPRLKAKPTERRSVVRVWCIVGGSLLLHRNPATARRLANIHELPTPEQAGLSDDSVAGQPLLARASRGITRFRITESIHSVARAGNVSKDLVWIPIRDLGSVTLSGPHRRWSDRILSSGASALKN
jgi:A/G-specific adenine glycosylase